MMKMESLFFYLAIVCFQVVATEEPSRMEAGAPQFVGDLKNISVAIGREAIFSCNVRALGTFKVGWVRFDSKAILSLYKQVITHDPRISLSGDFKSTFNLHIADVQEGDRGQYMCQINTNPMMFQTATLDVQVPPDINTDETSGDVEVKIGTTVKLKCNADGYPTPNIKWRREDRKRIKITAPNGRTARVEQFMGPNLTIHDVQTEDMGGYLCMADNGVPPIVSKRIFLYVHFAPEVATKGLVGAVPNRELTLDCEARGYPKVMVEWMRFGNVVRSNGAWSVRETEISVIRKVKTLKIFKAEASDMGAYTCRASNSIGTAERQVQLYLIDRAEDDETSTYMINPDQPSEPAPTTNPRLRHENEIQLQKEHQRGSSGSNANDIQSTIYDMFNSRQKESGQNYHSGSKGITNLSHSGTDNLQVKNAHYFVFACCLLLLL